MTADDSLYVLQVENSRSATKTFEWLEGDTLRRVATYDAGWRFRARELPPAGDRLSGIDDVAEWITSIEDGDSLFVIRGQLRGGSSGVVNRRYRDHHDDPHWQAHPEGRRWLMIDLDDLAAPEWLPCDPDPEDLRRGVRYATEQLPACFHNVTTFYQWSSSAGLVPADEGNDEDLYHPGWRVLRLHLWFWCDRPACCASLRHWFGAFRDETGVPVDPKLYNPVQPHFVAAPNFQNGRELLADARSGTLHGDADTVTLPDPVLTGTEWRKRERERKQQRERERERIQSQPRRRSRAQMEDAESRYAEAALNGALDVVRTAPAGSRHNTLSEQAFSMGTLVGAGALQRGETLRLLVDAAEANGLPTREAKRTARDGLEAGEANPRELTTIRRESGDKGKRQRRPNPSPAKEPTPNESADTNNEAPSVSELQAYFGNTDNAEGKGSGGDATPGEHDQEPPAGGTMTLEDHALEQFKYRAAWLEYCDGFERQAAEREARRRVLEQANGTVEAERIRRVLQEKMAATADTAAAS